MKTPKIGLLPMYIELYDKAAPEIREGIDAFHSKIAARLESAGLCVLSAPVCRLAEEFKSAVSRFESEGTDAIVTLHLAYSPSLESEKALSDTHLPIIVFDTTPDYAFDNRIQPERLMYDHGIHGVQDMCNLLKRHGKRYVVCAGHIDHGDVTERVVRAARAAVAASMFRGMRVGSVGARFEGMGDIVVPEDELLNILGIKVIYYDFEAGQRRLDNISREDITAERESDLPRFDIDPKLSESTYELSARTGLAIRKWASELRLNAYTINYKETGKDRPGLPVMPFAECSKAMARGTGYAGEGDALTAALCGALLPVFPDATFTEMFCPNWADGSIYMSHMGEMNLRAAGAKPFLTRKAFPFTDADDPTVAYAAMRGGECVLVNLAYIGGGRFLMTLCPGEMLSAPGENSMALTINGWFKPVMELPGFLEKYSELGASHHSVLVYGDALGLLRLFAGFLPVKCEIIM